MPAMITPTQRPNESKPQSVCPGGCVLSVWGYISCTITDYNQRRQIRPESVTTSSKYLYMEHFLAISSRSPQSVESVCCLSVITVHILLIQCYFIHLINIFIS